MKSPDQIRTYYENHLLDALQKRQSLRRRGLVFFSVGFVGIFGFTVAALVFWPLMCLLPVALPLCGWLIYRANSLITAFKDGFKKEIIAPLVSHIDPRLVYQEKSELNIRSLQQTHIFNSDLNGLLGGVFAEDQITATIGGSAFFACEIHSSKIEKALRMNTIRPVESAGNFILDELVGYDEVEHGNGHRRLLYLRLERTKAVSSDTVVCPVVNRNMWEKIADALCHPTFPSGKPIDVGDAVFHEHFGVMGQDIQNTQQLLSHELRSLLMKLRAQWNGPCFMSFVGTMIHVVILHRKNLFEVPEHSLTAFEPIQTFAEQVGRIVDVAENLNDLPLS